MKKKVNTDAMGNRISKTVINKQVTENDKYVTTYYVRDPQGNVLAVYEHQRGETGDGIFTLTEQHLYGSSRIGMKKRNLALSGSAVNESTPPVTLYELTNHLSNVVAVITDEDNGSSNDPKVESLTDCYPFGMEMGGRSYNSNDYRFGYTGHEKENDLAEGVYTTQYRLLDTRLGRWMSVDPLFGKYPDMSAYNYCGGNPVVMMDPDGNELISSHDTTGKYDSRIQMNKDLTEFFSEFPDVSPDVIMMNMHGCPNRMEDKYGQKLNSPTSVKNWLMRNSKVYQKNNPRQGEKKPSVLVLLSCSVAKGPGNIAQQISMTDEIPLVIAPDEALRSFSPNDHHQEIYKENERKPNEPGHWVVYYKGVVVATYSGAKTWGIFGKAYQITEILDGKTADQLLDKFKKIYEIKTAISKALSEAEEMKEGMDLTD